MESKIKTLGELPTYLTCMKLMRVSFATPKKNLAVYKFCHKVLELSAFIESEKEKLLKRYGDPTEEAGRYLIPKHLIGEYQKAMDDMLDTPVGDDLPVLGLTEEDFADEKCHYPAEKEYWLNAGEISLLLKF